MHRLACGNGRQWRETHNEQEVLVIDILLFVIDILLLFIYILLCVIQIPLRVVDTLLQ